MRAWQLRGPGLEELALAERPEPTPAAGQVVVRITAASLNDRDLMVASGTYQRGPKYPLVPLSDGAGEVVAVSRARALGADETINYRTHPEWQDIVRERTGGVDHVLEVGGKETIGRALRSLRYGAQLHLIGGVSGAATDLPLGAMAAAGARVRRIYVGSVAMFAAMNRAIEAHRLRPVVDRTFTFGEARSAYEHMKSASHFGKIVITG